MLDKNKVAIIGAAVGLAVGLLIAGIVWVASNAGDSPQATTTPSATPTPTETEPSGTPTATPTGATTAPGTSFDVDETYPQTAINSAVVAATWSGNSTPEQLRTAYTEAGFRTELVQSFVPLWKQVFDVPKVQHVNSSGDTDPNGTSISAATTHVTWEGDPDLVDTTGSSPHQQFRFAVTVSYRATWDQKAGSDDFVYDGKAIWYVTVDEATGKAVAVEQPRDSMTELTAAINSAKSRF